MHQLACYQLAQSILKKDFALAKRAGIGRGAWFQHGRKALTKKKKKKKKSLRSGCGQPAREWLKETIAFHCGLAY